MYRVEWFCHFDDDVYVNVKELSKLLSKYNSSEPLYIGRSITGHRALIVSYNNEVIFNKELIYICMYILIKYNITLYILTLPLAQKRNSVILIHIHIRTIICR